METAVSPPAPSAVVPLATLFRLWLSVGAQSFGGGTATLALIRQTFVERRAWVTEEELARDLALCQPVPGMNLLALTVLLGSRLGGTPGIFASLLGLLLPSVALTLLVTAFFSRLRDAAAVQAALTNGVVPATVGVGLYSTYQTGVALLRAGRREGRAAFVLYLLLLVGAALMASGTRLPVFLALLTGGAVGAAIGLWQARRARGPETEAAP